MWGMGSVTHNIVQTRDQFIDRRFWAQSSRMGEFRVKQSRMSLIETMFDDLSETGLLNSFNDFFSRMQELSRESHDPTFRLSVARTGETLTRMIRANAEQLQQKQRDVNLEVRAVVMEINSLGQQIASLNTQIHRFELDGSDANDLRDQRVALLDRLSELVNIEVRERDMSAMSGVPNDRRFSVLINGYDFINHRDLSPLAVVPRAAGVPDIDGNGVNQGGERRNVMDVDGLYSVRFANGATFNYFSRNLQGTLRGLIDVRDGNGGIYTTSNPIAGQALVSDEIATLNASLNKKQSLNQQFRAIQNQRRELLAELERIQEQMDDIDMMNLSPEDADRARENLQAQLDDIERQLDSPPVNGDTLVEIATQLQEAIDTARESALAIETIINERLTAPIVPALAPGEQAALEALRDRINRPPDPIVPPATHSRPHFGVLAYLDEIPANFLTSVQNSMNPAVGAGVNANAAFNTLDTALARAVCTCSTSVTQAVIASQVPALRNASRYDALGRTTNYKGIPFFFNRLNDMVRVFARAINDGLDNEGDPIPGTPGHRNGFGIDGDTGIDFFQWTDENGEPVGSSAHIHLLNALNFDMNPRLLRNPRLLATSTSPIQGESANPIVLGFINVRDFPHLFREGALLDYIIATAGHLAIDLQHSERLRNNYMELTNQTQNHRQMVSGVNMNEELFNMSRFYQLYNANARFIQTMQQVYDTLINRLGF
jgi:flagellar hook-associated protein FlgK